MPYKDPEAGREYARQYRLNHLEEIREKRKAYRKERMKDIRKRLHDAMLSHQYYMRNREKVIARVIAYQKRKREQLKHSQQ